MNHRDDNSRSDEPSVANGGFNTTHWSVVMLAGQDTSPESASALEHLCRTYWYPLYAYARRQGQGALPSEDALADRPGDRPISDLRTAHIRR